MSKPRPYAANLEGPLGPICIVYDAIRDEDAIEMAGHFLLTRINELSPDARVEIVGPDAKPIKLKLTVEMAIRQSHSNSSEQHD